MPVPVDVLAKEFQVIKARVQKRLFKKGDRVLIKNPRNIADYPAALRAEAQQSTCNDPFYATVEYDQEATTNYVKIVCDKGGRYLAEYNNLIYIPPGPARLTRTPGEAPPQPTPVAALADNATPLRRGDQPTRAPPSALGAPATTTECDRKLIGMTDRAETCEENLMKVKAELEAALAAHAAETAKLQGDLGVSQQALRRLDGVKAGLESDLVKTNRALDLIRNMLGEQTRKLGTLNTRYETLDKQKINLEGQLASERGKSAELSGDLVAERGTNAGLQAEARAAEAARAEADARATAAEAARLDAAARAAADERARAEAARAEAEARAAAEAAARLGAAAAAGSQAAALAEVRAAGEARAAAAEARAAAAAEAARAAAKARAEAEAAARAAEAARAEAAARATAAEARAEAEARAAADERARAGAAAAARAAAAAAAARAEGELAGLSEQLAAVTSERDDVTQKRRLLSEEIDRQRVELEVLQKKAADLEAQFVSTKALIVEKSDQIRGDLQAGVAHIDGGLQTIRRGVNDVSGLVSEANKQIGESRADFVKKMDALQRELEAANLQGRQQVLAEIGVLRAENQEALRVLNASLADAMTQTARLNGLLITETAAKAQAQGALQAAEAAAQAAAAARAQELADAKEASDIAFTKFREASERGNKAEIDAILAAGRENMEKLRRTLLEQQAIAVARADEAARGDLGRQLAALQAQITALPPPYVPPTPLPPQPFPIIRGRTPAGEVAVGSNINIQWEPRGTVGPWILKIFYDGVNPDFKDIQAEGNIAYTVKQPGALTGQIFSIV
jgi:predicted  nucleic acid-binding Zn-ribbon protein